MGREREKKKHGFDESDNVGKKGAQVALNERDGQTRSGAESKMCTVFRVFCDKRF